MNKMWQNLPPRPITEIYTFIKVFECANCKIVLTVVNMVASLVVVGKSIQSLLAQVYVLQHCRLFEFDTRLDFR
jgi:hypothetical protein